MTAETILIHDDAAVRTITLNRPHVRNAIDLRIALAAALEAAADDPAVRAVVLSGAGPHLLDCDATQQARLFDTDDFAEGIAAFTAKRAPQFGQRVVS